VSTVIHLALWLFLLPLAAACLYLLLLSLLSGALPSRRPAQRQLRFAVVIPAHDEAAVIGRTLKSLAAIDWPREAMRVLVVADNCTDDTAAIARLAGVDVLERRHEQLRGKGYALQSAFAQVLEQDWADALVVVDADSEVSPNLLEAFAARIEQGANVMQARYGVLNPWDSWRTRLMTIALAAFHIVRSRGRERLGVSCGLRGNGMCFTRAVLRAVPYQAYSLAEDIEYGIQLGLGGHRVRYVDEAEVLGEMVSNPRSATSQRQRWEGGRLMLARQLAGPLLADAWQRRSALSLDLAMDLLVLPLAYLVLLAGIALLAGGALQLAGVAVAGPLWVAAACLTIIVLYVLRGWSLSGLGWRGLVDLARAPAYFVWKLLALATRRERDRWVRTDRNGS
jgi:cellulose synthase/poly-beta-1,6-N-acetylglucosamine synthase-like glycosyltransferase